MRTLKKHRGVLKRRSSKQDGVVLFIALIVLISLSLAGIAIIRSTATSNAIAGNIAFKQGTLNAADLGIEMGVAALQSHLAGGNANADDVGGAVWYFATRRQADPFGVPTLTAEGAAGPTQAIDWSAVPVAVDASGGNAVQVVVDRLCVGPLPVTDILGRCFSDDTIKEGKGTKKAHESTFNVATNVYYRITVRVLGPRNTSSLVQAIITS